MTIDTNQFWNLLATSNLLPQPRIQSLFAKFDAAKKSQEDNSPQNKSPQEITTWLVSQKVISSYQASILLAGHSGPFNYGNYTVIDRFEKGQLAKSFSAIHRSSQHPVLLEFVSGSEPSDLKNWRKTETLVEKISPINHPNLLSIFETVSLPSHRFAVTQRPNGGLLSDLLPRRGRFPIKNACSVLAQAARGLYEIHQAGIRHGAISPNTIWIEKGGQAQIRLGLNRVPHETAAVDLTENVESPLCYLAPEKFQTVQSKNSATARAETTWPQLNKATKAGDIYSLGCLLYRMLAGQPPFNGSTMHEIGGLHLHASVPDLTKYDLPTELTKLLSQMLSKDPADRPGDLLQLSQRFAELSGKAESVNKRMHTSAPESNSFRAFRRSLEQFKPGSSESVPSVPLIETKSLEQALGDLDTTSSLDTTESVQEISSDRSEKISAAIQAARRRKQDRWKTPAAVAATLMAFSAAIGLFALNANRKVLPVAPPKEIVEVIEKEAEVPAEPEVNFGMLSTEDRPILLQEVLGEDDESLWETPTTGPPIDLTGLPLAPKMIFIFRPNELVELDEGRRVIESLGSDFRSLIDQWVTRSGFALADIDQLVVSLHSTSDFNYEPYFVVTLKEPIDRESLIQHWSRPDIVTTEGGQSYFASAESDDGFLILDGAEQGDGSDQIQLKAGQPATSDVDFSDFDFDSTDSTPDTNSQVSKYSLGSKTLIAEVASNQAANTLTGSMRKMADWIDRDRHLNILFLRTGLFNDEGQTLMGSRLREFNQELSLIIPDEVRGGMFSLHLDQGTYLEMMFDRTSDLKSADLVTAMSDQVRTQRDVLTQFVAGIQPSPYWDRVRLKYDNMLADLVRNLRWDVEHGEVAANCWLPPMAAHNLLAASELVVSFAGGSEISMASQAPSGPQTLAELMMEKRDLSIANPPDLNLLMADIESEINEDFRNLPFKFRIVILGGDLEKEGITKNQRPGELQISQVPLGGILTQIMTGANPSKDITGPADPNCKLVWVIADDPDAPGSQAVLITTRTAAAEKGFVLPDAFKTE